MIHTLSIVALSQLLPYQPSHHALDPLLSYDSVLCGFQARCVCVVDAVEGWGDFGLLCEEER